MSRPKWSVFAFSVLSFCLLSAIGFAPPDLAFADVETGEVLQANPESLNFGSVTKGTTSPAKTVSATNTSRSPVKFQKIVTPAPFLLVGNTCVGSLGSQQTCHINVACKPTAAGTVNRTLKFYFDTSRTEEVALTCTGVIARPTPTATASAATATPTPTPSPSPTGVTPTATVSSTPTVTATATCTPQSNPTPFVAGRVLIAGGQASDGTALNTAEVFNPATNTFTLTTAPALGGSNMNDGRYSHAAAPLHDTGGGILLSGGFDSTGVAKSTETFFGINNQFTPGVDMLDSRQGHTATSLARFQVLIAGGQDAGGTVLNSAEVVIGTATGAMNTPRVNAAAAVEKAAVGVSRSDTCPGPVIVTGGSDGLGALQSAELFDPNSHSFTLTDAASLGGSQMNAARVFHTATLLTNSGNLLVLVAGGEGVAGTAQASAEIFTVATNKFTLTTALGGTDMTVARAEQTATALGPTTVLITGGINSSGIALASAETFDLSTNSFTAVGSMHSARFNHAAAMLPNGKVLITGGEDGSANTLNTAEIFDPVTNTFTLTTDASLGGNNMNVARKLHTATAY